MGTPDAEEVHARLTEHVTAAMNHVNELRRILIYTIGITVLTILLVVGSLIVYTNHTQDVSNRRWCSFMTSLDQRYQQIKADPNADPDAKRFADQVRTLRASLGC